MASKSKPRIDGHADVGSTRNISSALEKKMMRVNHVNALIATISDHGRRFFYNAGRDQRAKMMLSRTGHIYFQDDYSGKLIYVAYQGRWRGFSHGGTLKNLVERLADYIRTGDPLSIDWIGPERFDQSNIWGYSQESMAKCRAAAQLSPAICSSS